MYVRVRCAEIAGDAPRSREMHDLRELGEKFGGEVGEHGRQVKLHRGAELGSRERGARILIEVCRSDLEVGDSEPAGRRVEDGGQQLLRDAGEVLRPELLEREGRDAARYQM